MPEAPNGTLTTEQQNSSSKKDPNQAMPNPPQGFYPPGPHNPTGLTAGPPGGMAYPGYGYVQTGVVVPP